MRSHVLLFMLLGIQLPGLHGDHEEEKKHKFIFCLQAWMRMMTVCRMKSAMTALCVLHVRGLSLTSMRLVVGLQQIQVWCRQLRYWFGWATYMIFICRRHWMSCTGRHGPWCLGLSRWWGLRHGRTIPRMLAGLWPGLWLLRWWRRYSHVLWRWGLGHQCSCWVLLL